MSGYLFLLLLSLFSKTGRKTKTQIFHFPMGQPGQRKKLLSFVAGFCKREIASWMICF
jgi:hypothetical protein